jgi:hypothetical protein
MRCIILFSASQRRRAWVIRSENRPVVPNGASFFAKACDMRGQSTLLELITTGIIAQQFNQVAKGDRDVKVKVLRNPQDRLGLFRLPH